MRASAVIYNLKLETTMWKDGGGGPRARYCARERRFYSKDMQTISLKLPDDLLAQLEQEAKVRRVTKSLLVRESLEKALRGRSLAIASCYDLVRDLAGAVKGLPRDLADNPRTMEGFGE